MLCKKKIVSKINVWMYNYVLMLGLYTNLLVMGPKLGVQRVDNICRDDPQRTERQQTSSLLNQSGQFQIGQ